MNGSHEGETSSVEAEDMASGLEAMNHGNQQDVIRVHIQRQPVVLEEVTDIFVPCRISLWLRKRGKNVFWLSSFPVILLRYMTPPHSGALQAHYPLPRVRELTGNSPPPRSLSVPPLETRPPVETAPRPAVRSGLSSLTPLKMIMGPPTSVPSLCPTRRSPHAPLKRQVLIGQDILIARFQHSWETRSSPHS